jgi:hypothetical protein
VKLAHLDVRVLTFLAGTGRRRLSLPGDWDWAGLVDAGMFAVTQRFEYNVSWFYDSADGRQSNR